MSNMENNKNDNITNSRRSPKWIKCLICLLPIILICLVFLVNSKNDNKGLTQEEKEYHVYSLASSSGFDGTFEEWQSSLRHDEIEVCINGTNVMWKYKNSETEWKILYSILEYAGPNGSDGSDGADGANGLSAYEIWESLPQNQGKTESDFVKNLNPYAFWVTRPENVGKSEDDFWDEMSGSDGEDGKDTSYSLYQVYKNLGYTGTFEQWKDEYGNKTDGDLELDFIVKYKVLFFDDNNQKHHEIEVNKGEKIPTSEVPALTKDYHEFVGWFYDDNGVLEQWIFSGYNVTQSMVLYAKFEPITHEIIYNLDGGVNHIDNNLLLNDINDSFELSDPTRPGYEFTGWIDGDGDEILVIDVNNKYAKATWQELEFEIIYNLDGGINDNHESITVNDFLYLNSPTKVGYKFLGWRDNSGNLVTYLSGVINDIELTANWQIEVYTITYIVDGVIVTDTSNIKTITYEEESVLIPYTKVDYEFIGWYLGSIKVEFLEKVTSNLYLEAKFNVEEYKINYVMAQDYINHFYNPVYVSVVDNNLDLYAPTRDGYEFIGWYNIFGERINKVNLGNYTYVEARWELQKYTITYHSEFGGTNVNIKEVDYSTIWALAPLSEDGYIFLGWYTNNDVELKRLQNVTNDIVLTAKWEIIEYSIKYHLAGGTQIEANPITITCIDNFNLNIPVMKYYEFIGWSNGEKIVNTLSGVYENIELTALWKAAEFEITYILNDGINDLNPNSLSIENERFELNDPTRIGYKFLGWYNGDVLFTHLHKLEYDLVLEAVWEIEQYPISYDLDGGEFNSYQPLTITINEVITLNHPVKKYYEFLGWETSYGTFEETLTLSEIDKEVHLIAYWKPIEYKVNYKIDADVINDNIDYINILNFYYSSMPLNDPYKENFDFDGWYTEINFYNKVEYFDLDLAVGEEITLYAKFKPAIKTDSNNVGYFYYGSYPQDELTNADLHTLFRETYDQTGTFSYLGTTYTYSESTERYYIHQPIRWNIISSNYTTNSHLVVSDIILDGAQYHNSSDKQDNFNTTSLYEYLNGEFIYKMFNSEEYNKIESYNGSNISIPRYSHVNSSSYNKYIFSKCQTTQYGETRAISSYSSNYSWAVDSNYYYNTSYITALRTLYPFYYSRTYGIKPMVYINLS